MITRSARSFQPASSTSRGLRGFVGSTNAGFTPSQSPGTVQSIPTRWDAVGSRLVNSMRTMAARPPPTTSRRPRTAGLVKTSSSTGSQPSARCQELCGNFFPSTSGRSTTCHWVCGVSKVDTGKESKFSYVHDSVTCPGAQSTSVLSLLSGRATVMRWG